MKRGERVVYYPLKEEKENSVLDLVKGLEGKGNLVSPKRIVQVRQGFGSTSKNPDHQRRPRVKRQNRGKTVRKSRL